MHSRKLENRLFVLGDVIASILALLFAIKEYPVHSVYDFVDKVSTHSYFIGAYVIFWLLFYYLFDAYRDIYRQSRLASLTKSFVLIFIGCLILYVIKSQEIVALPLISFMKLFFVQWLLTALFRLVIMTRASKKLKKGLVGFNTVIIGDSENIWLLYTDLNRRPQKTGHHFIGYISSDHKRDNIKDLPYLGSYDQLPDIIESHTVEEALVAVDKSNISVLKGILNSLFEYKDKVLVKVVPDLYDILLGSVKMNHVYGAVLIEVNQELMPKYQRIVKRIIDVIVSSFALLVLCPFLLYAALRVKLSSDGPILYRQERIGYKGQPFTINKFRSMYVGAETDGPALSTTDDPRCTAWGATMRKWRIDELPQFWNVLIGDMSLVGPRPERAYFIDKIMEKAPHYKHLLKVKPGITSWGQVKYGYASDVQEMLKRLQFDILYIENMSLALDFKIIAYTIIVLIQGKGK